MVSPADQADPMPHHARTWLAEYHLWPARDASYTCGDEGAVYGSRWSRAVLFTRALTIGGGTTDVQLNIIGERLLGLPRDAAPGTGVG